MRAENVRPAATTCAIDGGSQGKLRANSSVGEIAAAGRAARGICDLLGEVSFAGFARMEASAAGLECGDGHEHDVGTQQE